VIEEVIEPFLIQRGLLQRSPRGRMLTGNGYRHLGLPEPDRAGQLELIAPADPVPLDPAEVPLD